MLRGGEYSLQIEVSTVIIALDGLVWITCEQGTIAHVRVGRIFCVVAGVKGQLVKVRFVTE